jgi:hypothetical protein
MIQVLGKPASYPLRASFSHAERSTTDRRLSKSNCSLSQSARQRVLALRPTAVRSGALSPVQTPHTGDLHDILQARGIDSDFLGVSRTGGAAAAGARICTVTCLEREVARVTQRKQPDKGA